MPYSKNAKIELIGKSAELERALLPITAEMNRYSLRVNHQTWLKNLTTMEEEMMAKVEICRQMTGDEDFRPNSPADCANVLFKELENQPKKMSQSAGRPSMDKDVLSELDNKGVKLAGAILEARSAISCHSQLKAWKPYALAGAVQPVWDSMGQPQGRYTSDSPCINNRIVPIRETIEPNEGYTFLSLDLGQAEYVTWASLAQDEILGAAFVNGTDFHTATAEMVKDLVPEWNLRGEEMRAAGKTLNFAMLYRMKAWTLARKLGCSGEIAEKIIAAYFNRASKAQEYVGKVLEGAKQNGFVETYFGRRRYCPEYRVMKDGYEKSELEKTCWHHHNAGTAAELLKFKQLHAWQILRNLGFSVSGVWLAMQMYDECIWAVRDDLLGVVKEVCEKVWTEPEPGFYPLAVDVRTGKNWKEISK